MKKKQLLIKKSVLSRYFHKLPGGLINNIFLTFPFIYKTNLINYETGTNPTQANNLKEAINHTKNLKGEIIECGSNRCGTTSILAMHLKKNNINKKIYALDSFTGFDLEELQNERDLELTTMPLNHYLNNSYNYVIKKIKKIGLTDFVIPIKGYFEETLPKLNMKFCFVFIDCDLGESIKFSAENLWPKLSSNGIIYVHDYDHPALQNVKPYVDKFVIDHNNEIKESYPIDGMYFIRKK